MIRIVGREGAEHRIAEKCTVEELLRSLGLREQSYVCLKNGTPLTRFDDVEPDDDIILMEIFSGG